MPFGIVHFHMGLFDRDLELIRPLPQFFLLTLKFDLVLFVPLDRHDEGFLPFVGRNTHLLNAIDALLLFGDIALSVGKPGL